MQIYKSCIYFFVFLFTGLVSGNIDTYLYKTINPSHSVWGTTGLVAMPNARFHESGVLSLNYSNHEPYQRLALIAYPFEWFEQFINILIYEIGFIVMYLHLVEIKLLKTKGLISKIKLLNESRFCQQQQ